MKKVAHVFKSLSAGGIEKWLTDVAEVNVDRKVFEMEFLLQSDKVGFFEKKVSFTSTRIKKLDLKKGYFKYLINLYKELKINKYDVVHSHVHHFSGLILLIAFVAGVKVRVAHSHNDKRDEYSNVSLMKKIYFAICKILILIFANRKIAVSDNAAKSLFPYSLKKTSILPCGLNLQVKSSEIAVDRIKHKKIIGHIGSFSPQKNHKFICQLAKDLNAKFPGIYELHLVGHGKLYQEVERIINSENLQHCIKLLGLRDDVKNLIINEFDIVILPSLHEGLAMVALETQYYGKPLILSDRLSKQHTFSNYIEYASINDTSDFIKKIIYTHEVNEVDIENCRNYLNKSPMSVFNNIAQLDSIYN